MSPDIYLIASTNIRDDYSGREYEDTDADLDHWFDSEESARKFMRDHNMPTHTEQVERMSAEREEVYRAALAKYTREMRGVNTAIKSGISPFLLVTPKEPARPGTPRPQSWYEVVAVSKYDDTRS